MSGYLRLKIDVKISALRDEIAAGPLFTPDEIDRLIARASDPVIEQFIRETIDPDTLRRDLGNVEAHVATGDLDQAYEIMDRLELHIEKVRQWILEPPVRADMAKAKRFSPDKRRKRQRERNEIETLIGSIVGDQPGISANQLTKEIKNRHCTRHQTTDFIVKIANTGIHWTDSQGRRRHYAYSTIDKKLSELRPIKKRRVKRI